MSENALPHPLSVEAHAAPERAAIPLELVFYALLFSIAAALRLLGLDSPPNIEELPNLLAAWNHTPSASPVLYWTQALSFDLLGSSIVTARLLTAIVGTVLAGAPLLFRAELGRTRTLMLTLLLTVSAPLVITSRTSSPVVWTALFGVLALRLWMNQVSGPSLARGIQAVVATAALLLLGDPSGVVLALLLVAGAALSLFWRAAVAESDVEAGASFAAVRTALRSVAWDKAVMVAALVVVATMSGFMTAPSGLSTIGKLLGGIGRLFASEGESMLGVALFYQVFVWGLAIAALLYDRSIGWSAADRFFVGWLIAGIIASVALPGLQSQHSVLLALPLCGLVSGLATACFAPDKHQAMLSDKYAEKGDELAMLISPPAGRFILLIIVCALLFIFNIHFGSTAREILQVQDGSATGAIARMQANFASPDFRIGLLWSFISFMFLLVGFFLAGSIWGNRVAVQGYTLGFIAMLIVTQVSSGWFVTKAASDYAAEPWHMEATTHSYGLLEDTLNDLAFREAQGLPILPITVVRNPAIGLTEDGVLGWMLREYSRVRWVDSDEAAATDPIIIAQERSGFEVEQPNFGGSYVGQPFAITKKWSPDTMIGLDFLTWIVQRNVRFEPSPWLSVTLWVRQDVFEHKPVENLLR